MRLTWRQRLAVGLGDALQRVAPWHRLPRPLGLLCLIGIRIRLRFHNLYDPAPRRGPGWRAGTAGFPFGRNQPLWDARAESGDGPLLDPSPRVISERLLARDGAFAAVPFLNLLAAAWLQFQVHDWVIHDKDPEPSRKDQAPARAGRRLAPGRGRRHGAVPVAAQRGPADAGGAAGLRQQRHALVGREPDLRDHGGARAVAARVRGGAAAADRGRRPPARPRHGRPPERRHEQLVDRAVAAPLGSSPGSTTPSARGWPPPIRTSPTTSSMPWPGASTPP